jgi:tetratricopeptide (TPR) repeat protein
MVTEVANETRDADFNGVTELLRDQLQQSKYFNVLGDSEIRETEQRMGRKQFTPPDPQTAREIAMRQQVALVLFGTVSKLADEYKLDLKLEKIGNQSFYAVSSWRFGETARTKKDFFDVVQRGAAWIRKTSGEATADIRENERLPEEVTTDSWEALKLYSAGQQRAAQDDLDSAVLLFKQATVADPQFAMAYMRAGDILDTQGKYAEGFSYWKKALSVSGARRLATREELRLRGMFANDVGDLRGAVDFFGQYSLAFPTDYLGFFYRAYPLMLMGQPEEAIRMLELADKLNPRSYYVVDHLARYNLILGKFAETARLTAIVRSLGHGDEATLVEGQADFLRGDFRAAEAVFASLHTSADPFVRSVSFYQSASLFAEQGKYTDAISILREGINVDARFGAVADQADKLLAISYLRLKRGDSRASRDAGLEALRLETGLRRSGDAATILSRGGWLGDAEEILATLPRWEEYGTLARAIHARVKGEMLLARKQDPQALQTLKTWKDLDQEKASLRDSLAFAFARAGRSDDAYTELQAMRRYPGQVWHQPDGYLPGADADLLFLTASQAVRLKLPEARDLLVEYCKRRENADPDLPEVNEAIALLRHLGN